MGRVADETSLKDEAMTLPDVLKRDSEGSRPLVFKCLTQSDHVAINLASTPLQISITFSKY